VDRRHRLSRSRDFDAVYRRGRSTSTRSQVLYWFPRDGDDTDDEARLGIAVPRKVGAAVVRNRVKRQLREAWAGLLPDIPAGNDYVLIVREGLPDAIEAQGFAWLTERVREVVDKVAA
jgi:ribonuclease P protein component